MLTLVVTPADHFGLPEGNWQKTDYTKRIAQAQTGPKRLITPCITPNRPETGYGYIQYHEKTLIQIDEVKNFHEKAKPQALLKNIHSIAEDFVWNSGIFISEN